MALNYNFHNTTDVDTTDVNTLSVKCLHCGVLKFPTETESFCCFKGNIRLVPFPQPQPFLQHLYEGVDSDGNIFYQT